MLSVLRHTTMLRSILFGLLTLAMHLSIFQGQVVHGMAGREMTAMRHALLTPQPVKETHVHDDGEATEHLRGHTHSHNSSDHSHDTPLNVSLAVAQPRSAAQTWSIAEAAKMRDLGPSRLERPPALPPFA